MKPGQNCIDYAAPWKRAAKKWWKSEQTCWEMVENMADQITELMNGIQHLQDALQEKEVLLEEALKWRAYWKSAQEKTFNEARNKSKVFQAAFDVLQRNGLEYEYIEELEKRGLRQ